MTLPAIGRRHFLEAGGLALAGFWLPQIAPWRQREVVIHLRSDAAGTKVWFEPQGVAIAPGTRVRWVLELGVHTTTAYHPSNRNAPRRIPPAAAPWDSGYLLKPGQEFAISLTVPGVYDYFCAPHEAAGMVGRIVVGDPGVPPYFPEVRPEWRPLPAAAAHGFPDVERIVGRHSAG